MSRRARDRPVPHRREPTAVTSVPKRPLDQLPDQTRRRPAQPAPLHLTSTVNRACSTKGCHCSSDRARRSTFASLQCSRETGLAALLVSGLPRQGATRPNSPAEAGAQRCSAALLYLTATVTRPCSTAACRWATWNRRVPDSRACDVSRETAARLARGEGWRRQGWRRQGWRRRGPRPVPPPQAVQGTPPAVAGDSWAP